jgi:hypothetical protein
MVRQPQAERSQPRAAPLTQCTRDATRAFVTRASMWCDETAMRETREGMKTHHTHDLRCVSVHLNHRSTGVAAQNLDVNQRRIRALVVAE